jgi:hypothetical protein
MWLDTIHGIIDRRVLLNYRVDPAVLERILPHPFKPKLFGSYGICGICMIRFKHLRPRSVPQWLGLNSENAAHRIAVQWRQDAEMKEGVFIPRRDTNSWFNRAFGGRIFPGIFNGSKFESSDSTSTVKVRIVRDNGQAEAYFEGHVVNEFPTSSVFPSLDEAANFFSLGATGYSATRTEGRFHGMELRSLNWKVTPLAVDDAYSSFFCDVDRFPSGSITLDCALLMRGIEHEWHSRPDLFVSPDATFLSVSDNCERVR